MTAYGLFALMSAEIASPVRGFVIASGTCGVASGVADGEFTEGGSGENSTVGLFFPQAVSSMSRAKITGNNFFICTSVIKKQVSRKLSFSVTTLSCIILSFCSIVKPDEG